VTAPRRILYLSPTAQLGGAEYSLLDLAAGLDRRRYEPQLLCLGEGPLLAEAPRRGVASELVRVPAAFARTSLRGARSASVPLLAGVLRAAPTVVAVRRAARRSGAALLHSNGTKTHVLSAPLAFGALPVVWHVRDFLRDRPVERLLVRVANAAVEAVIANSSAVAAHLERRAPAAGSSTRFPTASTWRASRRRGRERTCTRRSAGPGRCAWSG